MVDIPRVAENYTLQKYADYDECVAMIKKVYELKKIVEFAGLTHTHLARQLTQKIRVASACISSEIIVQNLCLNRGKGKYLYYFSSHNS